MNTTVRFPIAKLLKEKGVNIKTQKTFYPNGEECDYYPYDNLGENNSYFWRPTIAEVVMWLYEKHGIWIETSKIDGYQNLFYYTITGSNGFNFGHKITVIEWDDEKCDEMGYNNKYNNSPTEAYEAAIEYTLNNLI